MHYRMTAALTALIGVVALAGCAADPAPSDDWTRWVCDSQAEVLWRFADGSREVVDLRLGGRYRPPPDARARRLWRVVQRRSAGLPHQG